MFSAAQSAALSPARETNGLIPESMSRPADIFLPTWHGGRPAAVDVHVISPLQQSIVLESAFTPGHALHVGTQRKLAAHLQPCRSVGVTFIPLVVESLGGLSEDLIKTARDIGDFMDQRVNPSHARSSCTKHLFHRLAVALWRGNDSLWLHRQSPWPLPWTESSESQTFEFCFSSFTHWCMCAHSAQLY